MDLPEAQQHVTELLQRIGDPSKVQEFLGWIRDSWHLDNLDDEASKADELLGEIAGDLRSVLPLQVEFQSETIKAPSSGDNADCAPEITVNVDAFLYDDDMVDELASQGVLSRNYCLSCGSKETKPLIFISHSASRNVLRHIFCNLLPPLDGKVVVDIGFRLGAVLYGASVHSKAKSIVGIEINPDFHNLASKVVEKYRMSPRVELLLGDVRAFPQVLFGGDVIVMNNVFEFFMTSDEQQEIWHFLKNCFRPGSLLVTIPSLEKSLSNLKTSISLAEWVEELRPDDSELSDNDSEESSVHMYRIR